MSGGALPETTTALRVHALGEAPRVDEIPMPRPQAGEVLVRLAATVVARHDLDVARGSLPVRQPLPYVPGLEGAGRVAAVGADVDGDRFAAGTLVRAYGGGLGVVRPGTWAEYVAAPAGAVRAVPEELDPAVAAACGSAALTAWAALHDVGAVGPDERLGVTGASGAVGSLLPVNMQRHRVPDDIHSRLIEDFAAGRLTVATDVVELPALGEAIARLEAGRAEGRVIVRW